MTLRRTGRHLAAPKIQRAKVQELLLFIGMSRKSVYPNPNRRRPQQQNGNTTFWTRNEYELDAILRDAHMYFKAAMKRAHPDKGGSVEQATKLNQAWARIRKLFARHGAALSL